MLTNFGRRLFYWSNHLLVYHQISFLGKFTRLREAIISFVMSVRPSVRMGQLGGFHWTDFLEI
jgi:hypothetical protein